MKLKHILSFATLALSIGAQAQTAITFETPDYKTLGVYDTWEASPFRTGALAGNFGIVDNPDKQVSEVLGMAPNPSDKVLAVQRSRFGSNTFGARIDLLETFELTPETQYVHVMVNRPYSGRVMVVGLGKRQDRAGQSPETEQFWGMTISSIEGGLWHDVVIPIKGAGGIDIHSLVVVPDCESPHAYTSDAICYIDNIEVNNNPQPKFSHEFYPISFDRKQVYTRGDRRLSGIALSSADGNQSFSIPSSPNYVYNEVTQKTFCAKAGETVTPTFSYTGSWMHGYVFIDCNNNGRFENDINDDYSIPESSEIMTFSYCGKDGTGKNSAGQTITGQGQNVLNPPTFVVPEGLANGFYRMRYKVDWNSVDPAGSIDTSNPILGNGGAICDILLNVHGDHCFVNDANRNGEVLAATGEKLVKLQVPFGEPFKIKMNPEQGFEYAGIVVKHGYNLSGDSIVKGNMQWQRVRISRELFDENDEYVIPGELMDGDVEIEGLFIEEGTYVPPVIPTRYAVTTISDNKFPAGTQWYTIQIGQQGYVLFNNGTQTIPLNITTIDAEDASQLWCFTGNEEAGYRIYNMQAGADKVLAAPTQMMGSTGSGSHPTMQPVGNLPSGYTDLWIFADSDDLGSNDVSHAYMYEKGHVANKVNNRDNQLAFWNGGADAGSTLRIFPAESDLTTFIGSISANEAATEGTYDLSGRKTQHPANGIFIKDGKLIYVK